MPRSGAIDRFRRKAARRLRLDATAAEQRLWRSLRRLELHGTHFRRQMPIGRFVADFVCPAARLIIEVDGSQHGRPEHRYRDQQRTSWLESEGYRVLRFWNNDISKNLDGVMGMIHAALYDARDSCGGKFKHMRRRFSAVRPHPGALRAPTLPLQWRVEAARE